MEMLSKPSAGWTDFRLGKTVYGLSYLTAVPLNWLEQAIHGLETLMPFTVYGFCEPGAVFCLVGYRKCYIIFDREEEEGLSPDGAHFETVDVNMLDFCKSLYTDINQNIDAWSQWSPAFFESPEEYHLLHLEEKKKLQMRLNRLEILINENTSFFSTNSTSI